MLFGGCCCRFVVVVVVAGGGGGGWVGGFPIEQIDNSANRTFVLNGCFFLQSHRINVVELS